MSEYKIQNILAKYLLYKKNHRYITPNSTMIFNWECDLVSVTDSNFIHEYEIKCSRSDFKNDVKNKKNKHQLLENKHHRAMIPNYFWYVTTNFDLELIDIPDYSGWITIENDVIKIEKKAPRISKRKINDYQKKKLFEAIYYRYWNIRTK